MLDPETGLIMFAVGGIGAVVSFNIFKIATEIGPKISLSDLRPCLPWEGPPIPVFIVTKPEITKAIFKR